MVNGKINMPVMPDMNGKNMVMPMLKVTLPIYRSKTRAGIKSAQLMQQSANDAYLRQQDELHAQYLSVEQRAEDAKRQASLYDNELKLLNQTLHLMVAEYANGTTSLTDILQTSRENIDYSLKKFEALARYNTIVAEYEKLASLHDYAAK
jgi:putative outer membrane efflux protein